MFKPDAQAPNKVGPFLPGLKTRGILGRFGEMLLELAGFPLNNPSACFSSSNLNWTSIFSPALAAIEGSHP